MSNKIPLNIRQDTAKKIANIERLKGGDYKRAYNSAMRQLQRAGTSAKQKRNLGTKFKDKLILAGGEDLLNTVESYKEKGKILTVEFYRYEREVPPNYIVFKRFDAFFDKQSDAVEICQVWENADDLIEAETGGLGFICLVLGKYYPAGTYSTVQKVEKKNETVLKSESRQSGNRVIVLVAVPESEPKRRK